jgi:hypothetical protein
MTNTQPKTKGWFSFTRYIVTTLYVLCLIVSLLAALGTVWTGTFRSVCRSGSVSDFHQEGGVRMHNGWENADPVRKSFGAFLVAWALVVVAIYAPLPWWGAVLVGLAVWLGLVAGLKIKWSYRR